MIRMNRNSEHTVSAVSSPAINLPMGSATHNYRSDLVNPWGTQTPPFLSCKPNVG
jgi:hypothetical protein